jgi:hypothetical protein
MWWAKDSTAAPGSREHGRPKNSQTSTTIVTGSSFTSATCSLSEDTRAHGDTEVTECLGERLVQLRRGGARAARAGALPGIGDQRDALNEGSGLS